MRTAKFSLAIVLLLTAAGASAQTGKPLMKVTIKDGAIIKSEPVDPPKSGVKLSDNTANTRSRTTEARTTAKKTSPVAVNGDKSGAVIPGTREIDAATQEKIISLSRPGEATTQTEGVPKGNTKTSARVTYGSAVLDQTATVQWMDSNPGKVPNPVDQTLATVSIMTENFEGIFPPGGWSINAYGTQAYWDDVSYRSYGGSWSGWCAAAGAQSVVPGVSVYPDDMNSWMVYGPFDLSDAQAAILSFKSYSDTEATYDYFKYMVSTNGTNYYGYQVSGNSSTWVDRSIDLTTVPTLGNVTGQPQVWIAFIFQSDISNGYEGSYVDDIILEKTTAGQPNLYWSSMPLSTDVWASGASISGDLTEVNDGTEAAGSHYTRIYLSTNDLITDADLQLGSDLFFPSIAAGFDQTQSFGFTVPVVSDGIYYVGAIVDYYNDVAESDEADNNFYRIGTIDVITPQVVDLYGNSLALSTETWVVGSQVTADFTEANAEAGTAGFHSSRLYLSTDTFIAEGEDILLGSELDFGPIAGFGTQTQSGSFFVPDVMNGTYYIGALIDYYDEVVETNEGNNNPYRTGTFTIIPDEGTPDLQWLTLGFDSETWIVGGLVNADLQVENIGDGPAGGHYSRLYLSTNDIISELDVQLGSDILFSGIPSLTNQTQSIGFVVPEGDGTYWVGALVDYYNDVAESDEGNNGGTRTGQVTVIPETGDVTELIPVSLIFSTETWNVGATIGAELTVENTGTLFAPAHSSRLVLSDNISISLDDLQLGSDLAFAGSNMGEFVTGTSNFIVPDVPTGEYYVGMFIDINNNVVENNESNNVWYNTNTVGVISSIPDIGVNPTSLTINETVGGSSASAGRVAPLAKGNDPYAPNQMIIKFRSDVGSSTRTMSTADKGLETLNAKYKVSNVRTLSGSVRQLSAAGGNMLLMKLDAATDIQTAISEYRKLAIVEFAEPDYIVKNTGYEDDLFPDDPMFISQWGLKNTGNAVSYNSTTVGSPGEDINAENAWNITTGSSNIIVAVIDDGVDLSHPEFTGRLVAGYDFVNDDNDPNPLSTDGHGNACAGIIAAAHDGVGVAGVAPGVRIMPLKVLQDGSGLHSDIIPAIYYAIDNGAKVISMSLGGSSSSIAYETAVNYAVSQGVVVLAAAGNDNADNTVTPSYPASYASVISVGAMSPCGLRKTPSTCDGEFWWGSNYGNLDFISPGTRIATTDVSGAGGYTATNYTQTFNGTSAATPFAAGVAALILSYDPSLTPAEVRQIMQASAVDVGAPGYDSDNGFGRLDAYAALQLVAGGETNLVTITNEGEGVLTVNSISANQPWLSFSGPSTPIELSAGESAVLTLIVDWPYLLGTSSTSQITIQSNDSDELTVVVDVTANPASVETFEISATASPVEGGSISGTGNYAAGQIATLTANPSTHYYFSHWTDENFGYITSSPEYSFQVTGARAFHAVFNPTSYQIEASANPFEGGEVEGEGGYTVGQTATLTATPLGVYEFLNWTEDDEIVSHNASYSFTVSGHRTLVANFAVEFYTIGATVDPPSAGTVLGAGRYSAAQTASLTALPSQGFQFESWKEDGDVVSTDPTYIFTATANRNLVAQFSIETRTVSVTINPALGGSVTGQGVYNYGEQATLQAFPAGGYGFVNWTKNGVEASTVLSYTFTVIEDVNLVANFQLQQSISFEQPASYTYGDGSFNLVATATSGLTVAFMSSNSSKIQIDGTTATILEAGPVDITAYQLGDAYYLAAAPVTYTVTINKAFQSITFSIDDTMLISDEPMTLIGMTVSDLPITFESSAPGIVQINGNQAVPVGIGTATITAKQGGNVNYLAAPDVSEELQVLKGSQSISFGTLPAKTFGDQAFELSATSSSGLPLIYVSSNPDVATVSGNTVTIGNAGSTTITASQEGNDAFYAASPVDQLLTINKSGQFINFSLQSEIKFALAPVTLNASTLSGLNVSFESSNTSVATVSGNTLTLQGVGVTTIIASQGGNENYNAANNVQRTLTIRKGDQQITFEPIVDKLQGTPDFSLGVTTTSELAPILVSSDPARLQVTVVGGNEMAKILAPGRVSVAAFQRGNANWNAAESITRSFCITPAKPTITLSNQATGFPTLTSSSPIGNHWYRNGVEVQGTTDNTLVTTPDITNPTTQNGNYTLIVKIETCTSATSDAMNVVVTSVEESLTAISVYPNPFMDEVYIDVSGIAQGSQATVKMYDATGRVQRSAQGSGEIRLEAAGLSSGAYLLQIQAEDRIITKRIVKVR